MSLLDELVGGVDDVFFLAQHLVDLDELLEVFLVEDDMFGLALPLERVSPSAEGASTYRLPYGTVRVSRSGGDDF